MKRLKECVHRESCSLDNVESLQKENAELKTERDRLRDKKNFAFGIIKKQRVHINNLKLTLSGRTFSDSDLKIKLDKAVEALKIY